MSYFIVITDSDPYEFLRINGKIARWDRQDEALLAYRDAIEKHGLDYTYLLEKIHVRVTTEVSI